MSEYASQSLPEPHIFYEIHEILNFTDSSAPTNKNLKVVGVYMGPQNLTSFVEHRGQKVHEIALDLSHVDEFPALETTVEVFGVLNVEVGPKIEVEFWTDLGYDGDKIRSYLECLRTARYYININLFNQSIKV